MELKFGLIGYGKMGQIRAKAATAEGGEIVSVYDVHIPAECPYEVADSIEAVIADPRSNIISVSLPNYLNKSVTIASLRAGKHVFCEKPPAFNAADVREIQEAERLSGKTLMYGFNHRHHEAVLRAKELIDSGSFGRILWMRGRYGKSVDGNYLKTWRTNKELAGGGILLDQGIHMLDLFLFLSGQSFDKISALVSNLYWNTPGIEDNVFAILGNSETGLSASLHSTMTQWRHLFSLEVFMEAGYFTVNGLKTSSGTYGDEVLTIARNRATVPAADWDTEERLQFPVDSSWAREAKVFLDAIRTGSLPTSGSSEQALTVMEHIDRIYASDERFVAPNLSSDLRAVLAIEPPPEDGAEIDPSAAWVAASQAAGG